MGGPLIPPWVALQPILLIIDYFRTKICQHTLFSNATLYLRLIKSKSVCLGGANRFFQILVKQRRLYLVLSMVVNIEFPKAHMEITK